MTRRAACSCGQLNLAIEGEPSRIAMCHCLECQRRTGAVISNQARLRCEQVTIAGKATAWMRTAESGNAMTFHFCPTCGSTVYWENEGIPGYVTFAIGNFAGPNFPAPTSQCGRSYVTPGSPCRPTHRPSAWQGRGDNVSRPELPGIVAVRRETGDSEGASNTLSAFDRPAISFNL